MRYTFFNEILSFESGLEWTHVYAWVNLEEINFFQGYWALYLAGAYWQMWKPPADYILFVVLIRDLEALWLASLLLFDQIDVVFNLLNLSWRGTILHCLLDTSHVVHVLSMGLIKVIFTLLLLNHLKIGTVFHIFLINYSKKI